MSALRGPFAGTEGHRDAPYWQTPPQLIEGMLDLAGAGPADFLIDLGCGDGRTVIAAARRGSRALGVDLDAERIAEAQVAAAAAGLASLAHFRCEDLFRTRLEEATIVTLYLLPHVNFMLRDRLRGELRPGSRVVSHAFPMPDWAHAQEAQVHGRYLYLWIVPETPGDQPAGAR